MLFIYLSVRVFYIQKNTKINVKKIVKFLNHNILLHDLIELKNINDFDILKNFPAL